MFVQDFFSVVQLGAGLHAGTAILQMSSEFGIAPLVRRLDRVASCIENERLSSKILNQREEDLEDARLSLIIIQGQHFGLYRKAAILSMGVSFSLIVLLVTISFFAGSILRMRYAMLICAWSTAPALLALGYLHYQSSRALRPIYKELEKMEDEVGK